MLSFTVAGALLAASLVSAAHDPNAKLDKPPLHGDLNYLKPGLLANLPETDFKHDKWEDGWISKDCKYIVEGNVYDDVKYNPADFEVYNVHYSDCSDAWVFCHHKDSPITIDSMARQFGKVPIQMRQWVRHVIDVPDDAGWAFEYDGTVTFLKPGDDSLSVILHETGHSLDLSGAYNEKPMSSSDKWWDNYGKDSKVPDDYAQTNAIEDVAQNTVVAVFNENVEGGFGTVEPGWEAIKNQYQTLIAAAADVGKGNSLFKPGQDAKCTHRLPPSAPVSVDGSSSKRRDVKSRRGAAPKVGLSDNVVHLDTRREGKAKRSDCSLRW